MDIFLNIFKNSIRLPKRKAAFTLNRIGMDMVILYMFLLLALASLPGLIEQIQTNADTTGIHVKTFFLLIFFFIFYYLVVTTAVLTCLSVIAYIGTLIARAAKRKLRYAVLWKTAACITTIPVLIFTLLSFFFDVDYYYLAAAFVFHLYIFTQTIFLYPRRRHLD